MRILDVVLQTLRIVLMRTQEKLAFQGWSSSPQFATNKGLGRVALLGAVLAMLLGVHLLLVALLSCHQLGLLSLSLTEVESLLGRERIVLCWQWCAYVVVVCTFHLAEFFVTAFCNPSVVSSDSYLVNHSIAYTAAALLSWMEFWIRFWFLPSVNSLPVIWVGLVMVAVAEGLRVSAMVTCGESFNHLIQTSKKDNHVLITHGIYKYLRHPSYVGFYYWAVGTQLVLCNFIHIVLYAVAAWTFFHRRIPFEEQSLLIHFPDEYPAYVARTWMGIPFVRSRIRAPSSYS